MILAFLCCGLVLTAHPGLALSIRVLPGGIPVGSPEQLMSEGIRLGNSHLLRQAWNEYEKSVTLAPHKLEGYYQLGRIFFHLSLLRSAGTADSAKALGYARQALALAPQAAESHRILALVFSGKGAYLDAMDELRLAMQLNPGNEFVLCDMAVIHLALRQPAKAVALLEGQSLKNGWSYFVLAVAWMQQGQNGKALINLKKAERSGFVGFWLDQAQNAIKQGRPLDLPPQSP
jgi:tetratricopeptide (TPR) repeat protein